MQKIKNWFIGAGIAIATVFGGHHVITPKTIEVNPTNPVVVAPSPTATPTPVVNAYPVPHMTLGKFSGTEEQKQMVLTAFGLDNDVLASQCFKTGVLSAHFTEKNGLTNQQIYDTFAKHEMILNVTIFYGSWAQNHWSKTIGYEWENDPYTCYENSYFVETAYDSADNQIHEAAHGLGFRHDGFKGSSVPYQMNDIFELCAKELGIKNQ